MPPTCRLQALNELSGQALFQRDDRWYSLSIDDGWEPRALEDFREALRLAVRSNLLAEDRQFADQAELVSFVRRRWKARAAIPAISVRVVLHLLPLAVRATAAPQPPGPQPSPRTVEWDVYPPGTAAVWELVQEIATSLARRQVPALRPAVEDLASEAMLRLFRLRARVEEAAELGEVSFRAFVAGVVRTTALDLLRWSRRWGPLWPPSLAPWWWPPPPPHGPPYALSLERDQEFIPEEALIDPASLEPTELVERLALADAVRHALSVLRRDRPRVAAVVAARLFHEPGRTYVEIAKELGVTVHMVHYDYMRGIQVVRTILRDLGWGPPNIE